MIYQLYTRLGVILLLLICLSMLGCEDSSLPPEQSDLREYSRENFIMNTLVTIRVYSSDPALGKRALAEAFAEFQRIDKLSNRFAEKNLPHPELSDVYRVNKNAGLKPVKVSNDTLAMLDRSQYFAGLSEGAFDVTVGPLMDLWGFGKERYQVPSATQLESALALVGYKRILINETEKTVFLREKGMEIDLGGVAKGYATDMAVQKLRQIGIKSAIINAGGSIYALGLKPDGSPWRTGIRDPRDVDKIIAVLEVRDAAVVSYGDYERYFIRDGVRYHHILDPVTGQPARKLISSTIVAPQATDADLLSTAIFVLGSSEGKKLIEEMPNTSAVLVDASGVINCSTELAEQIEFIEDTGYQVLGNI